MYKVIAKTSKKVTVNQFCIEGISAKKITTPLDNNLSLYNMQSICGKHTHLLVV